MPLFSLPALPFIYFSLSYIFLFRLPFYHPPPTPGKNKTNQIHSFILHRRPHPHIIIPHNRFMPSGPCLRHARVQTLHHRRALRTHKIGDRIPLAGHSVHIIAPFGIVCGILIVVVAVVVVVGGIKAGGRRQADAVQGGFQSVVGPALHQIADIHHDGVP